MKYWVTTHWPMRTDEDPDRAYGGVWVIDGKEDVIEPMRPGHLIWIYVAGSGKAEVRRLADGSNVSVPCRQGPQAVVALVEARGRAFEPEDSEPTRYADESEMWWRWHVPTKPVNSAGRVGRKRFNELMGYQPTYNLRGFGDRHSGLKEITRAQHEMILEAFLGSYASEESSSIERASIPAGRVEGGEGPLHRAMKDAVAGDPVAVLGEPGLQLVEKEFAFGATGDRIDVF